MCGKFFGPSTSLDRVANEVGFEDKKSVGCDVRMGGCLRTVDGVNALLPGLQSYDLTRKTDPAIERIKKKSPTEAIDCPAFSAAASFGVWLACLVVMALKTLSDEFDVDDK